MSAARIVVATAQSPVTGDVGRNGRAIRALMRRAAAAGARLVHFPEGALSGYARNEVARWEDFDFCGIRRELEAIAALAAALRLWVVVGCAHRLTPPNRPHNSLYVISDEGQLATRYDKRRCSHTEISYWFSPGFDACLFAVDGIRFACALCIEIQFPELFAEAARANADCVLFSAYSSDPMMGIQAQGYAASHNLWFSVSTPVDASRDLPGAFVGPDGRIVARCRRGSAALVVNTIDPEAPEWEIPIKRARPWRTKARVGAIYEERRVSDPLSIDRAALS